MNESRNRRVIQMPKSPSRLCRQLLLLWDYVPHNNYNNFQTVTGCCCNNSATTRNNYNRREEASVMAPRGARWQAGTRKEGLEVASGKDIVD